MFASKKVVMFIIQNYPFKANDVQFYTTYINFWKEWKEWKKWMEWKEWKE